MRTIVAFTFSELTEEQQRQAFEAYREKFSPHEEWYDSTIDHVTEALEFIGFSDVRIGFQGFWSQGDGAHFSGGYSYKKGALKAVKKDYPQWHDLHLFAKQLQEASRKSFYSIGFTISHRGHYSHEMCTSFDFEDVRTTHGYVSENFVESDFIDPCRSFMRDIYQLLKEEYEDLSSFECVKECPENYDYLEFELDESGKPKLI